MEIISIILSAATIVLVVLVFVNSRKGKEPEQQDDKAMMMLNQNMQGMQQRLDETTKSLQQTLHTQLSESTKVVRDVTEKLTKFEETNRQVTTGFDQIRQLQELLKNPKQRGQLGEYFLETVLKNVLPPDSYQMQYAFPDGEIVDAVVKVAEKLIPVDSKFSLENYNRISEASEKTERERLEKLFLNDLKNRIQETSKYIRPQAGTMDFAFMFIPHEAIYYDLLVNKIGAVTEDTENLIQRAASKYHVIIVSPTSFLAYLQTVLQGLRALKIEESAKDIIKNVGVLGKHLKVYEEYFLRLGSNLGTTVNAYNLASKELGKIDKDVVRIGGESIEHEISALPKPDENE